MRIHQFSRTLIQLEEFILFVHALQFFSMEIAFSWTVRSMVQQLAWLKHEKRFGVSFFRCAFVCWYNIRSLNFIVQFGEAYVGRVRRVGIHIQYIFIFWIYSQRIYSHIMPAFPKRKTETFFSERKKKRTPTKPYQHFRWHFFHFFSLFSLIFRLLDCESVFFYHKYIILERLRSDGHSFEIPAWAFFQIKYILVDISKNATTIKRP